MSTLRILNSKETKESLSLIETQWGAKPQLDYALLMNNQNKVFLVNKDIGTIDISRLRVNSIGMYLGEVHNGIRLSIEGSQLIGPFAKKNIASINENQARQWMEGSDIETNEDLEGFVLVKYNDDFLGCGKFAKGKVLNFVGKERRIKMI